MNNNLIKQITNCYIENKKKNIAIKKSRKNTSYSNKKLAPQKGTGKARIGSRSSPILIGGAKSFANKILSKKKINKKMYIKCIKIQILNLIKKNNIFKIKLKLKNINTKNFIKSIKNLYNKKEKILIIKKNPNKILKKSCKNIHNINIINIYKLTPINILNINKIIYIK